MHGALSCSIVRRMEQVTPWTWYPCAVQLDFQLVSRVHVEDAYGGHKKETLVTPYVPFALLLFVLLLLLLFILGLYQCVGFCVCVRAVSRLMMIVSD